MNRYDNVPGAFGIGKVKLVYKPKKKYKRYGIYFMMMFLLVLGFSYCFGKPRLRYMICLPILRYSLNFIDLFRQSKYKGIITMPGPKYNVTINRYGNNGVPLIVGNHTNDVLFAQGYLHAVDRMFQLDMARRVAMGTYSELMGKYYVKVDMLSRALNIAESALEDVKKLSAEDLESLEAYSNGINSYSFFNPDIPFEFSMLYGQYKDIKEWEPVHTMAILRMHLHGLMHGWEDEFTEFIMKDIFGPDIMKNLPKFDVLKDSVFPSVGGSAWLVSGSKTSTKKPILAFNLYSVEDTSKGWFMNSLVSPEFNASGASIPGIPFIMMGHNRKIIWSMLGLSEKSESLTVIDENQYCNDDTCENKNSKYAEHIINVQNETTPSILSQKIVKIERINGQPIMNEILDDYMFSKLSKKRKIYTLSQKLSKIPLNMAFFRNVIKSDNFKSVQTLAASFDAPINILYADNQNNIGYVKAGSSKQFLLNPSSGYIIFDQEIIQHKESYIISKLSNAMNTDVGISIKDMHDLQNDVYSPSSLVFKDLIMKLDPDDASVIEAQEIVKNYGGHYAENTAAPVLLEMFRMKLRDSIMHLKRMDGLGNLISGTGILPLSKPRNVFKDDLLWLTNLMITEDAIFQSFGSKKKFIHKALIKALDDCKETFGNYKSWKWGVVHSISIPFVKKIRLLLDILFASGFVPAPGGIDTYFRSAYSLDNYGASTVYETFFTTKGTLSTLRMIFDTNNFDNTIYSMPMSNHRRIGSSWYQDHFGKIAAAWAAGKYESLCSSVTCLGKSTQLFLGPGDGIKYIE